MILVVDATTVVAALIKNSAARAVLLSGKFKLVAPEFLKDEVGKYVGYIAEKSGLTKEALNLLITMIFQEIELLPAKEYESEFGEAKKIMQVDPKDAPYVACYLALKCDGIWTSDPHYRGKQLKTVSTSYLLKLLGA